MIAEAARVQAVLEGVPLPAGQRKLIEYASAQPGGASTLGLLARLPDREYRSLDEVGEVLAPVQPRSVSPQRRPQAESGDPPGGTGYTSVSPEPGAVRTG